VPLKWLKQQRGHNISVSGCLLVTQVEEFVKRFSDDEFVCIAGWVNRFSFVTFPLGK
jgi:hypothetical protein